MLKIRQERSAPVLAAFREWVEKLLPGVPPTSALGKALSYTMKQWPKFGSSITLTCAQTIIMWRIRSGRLPKGAGYGCSHRLNRELERALIYTLVSGASVNGLEPYAYLRYLFEELPKATTAEALEALLPWNVKNILRATAP